MIPDDKLKDLKDQAEDDPKRVKQAFNLMLDNMPTRKKEKKLKQRLNNAENSKEIVEAIEDYIS